MKDESPLAPNIETISYQKWIETVLILFEELKRKFIEKEYYVFPNPPVDDTAISENEGGKAIEMYLNLQGNFNDLCMLISKDGEPHFLCDENTRKEYDNSNGWPIVLIREKVDTFLIPSWIWPRIDKKHFKLSTMGLVKTYRYYFKPLLESNFEDKTPGRHNVFERIIFDLPVFDDMKAAEIIIRDDKLMQDIWSAAKKETKVIEADMPQHQGGKKMKIDERKIFNEAQHGIMWINISESTDDNKYYPATIDELASAMQKSAVPEYIKAFFGSKTRESKKRVFVERIAQGVYQNVIISIRKGNKSRIDGYAIIKKGDDPFQSRINSAIDIINKLRSSAKASITKSAKRSRKRESA